VTQVPDALCLSDLSVAYNTSAILHGLSLSVARGECVGLVGESGCGKSTAAFAAMRALPRAGRITGGSVSMDGVDVLGLSPAGLRALWTRRVSMVYQDPSRALTPPSRSARSCGRLFPCSACAIPPAGRRRCSRKFRSQSPRG